MESSHKMESNSLRHDVERKSWGSKGRSETAEKVQEVQQRSTKSAAGSSSSKISSSIAGPIETQESMTFAANVLSGAIVAGLPSSEENNQTEEFTAQFSFYENEGKRILDPDEFENQTRMIIEKPKPPAREENLAKISPDPVANLVNQGWKSFIKSMQKGENQLFTVYKDEPLKSPGEQVKEKKSSETLGPQNFTPNFAGPGGGQIQKRVPLQEVPQNLASFGKPQKQQQILETSTPMAEEDKENYRARISISSYNTKASTLPSFQDFLKAHKTRTGNVMSRLEGSARSNKPESEAPSSVANEEQKKSTSERSSGGMAPVGVNQQSPMDLIPGSYSGVKVLPLPYSPGSNPQRKSLTTTDISYQSGKSSLNESSLLLNELPVILEYPEITQMIDKKSSRRSSTRGNLESSATNESEEFTDEDEEMESHSEFCSTCDFEDETQYGEEEEQAPIILLNKTIKKGNLQEQGSSQNLSGRRKQSGSYEEIFFQEEDDDSDTFPQTGYISKKGDGDVDLMGNLQQKIFPLSKILTRQELTKKNEKEEDSEEEEDYDEGDDYYSSDGEDESSEIQEIQKEKFQEENVIKKLDFKEDQMEENISGSHRVKTNKGERMEIISLGTSTIFSEKKIDKKFVDSGQKQEAEVTKNDVENLTAVFNSLEDDIWDIKGIERERYFLIKSKIAQEKIFEKNVRVFQASMTAADEWLDHLFALAEDKPEVKDTLSLTSSELNKIFGDDP